MRTAILDLGTNTFHLMIADVNADGTFKKIFKSKIAVKLGEGDIHLGRISEEAFERGIDTLKHYHEIILKYRADEQIAVATSAIRSAENGLEFIERAKEATGLEIRIISGEEEARLIYEGVRECVNLGDHPKLIMDIGGGSIEFIIADQQKIYWMQSYNIGAARLLASIKPSDPVTKAEIKKIELILETESKDLRSAIDQYPVSTLVGASGSFETYVEMISHRFHHQKKTKRTKSYKFNLEEYYKLHEVLLDSITAQRMRMKGLIRMRVDMIVIASIYTNYVLRTFQLNEMILSRYALKEGTLIESLHADQHIF